MLKTQYASQQIKAADTHHPIHPLLQQRWSPRAFDSRPVEPAKLASLFEAARWSASGANLQPWHFLVATKEDASAFAKLASVLSESNQEWANHAPVLILAVAKTVRPNGQPHPLALFDLGLAVQNLSIQATALDLHVHSMAGFSADRARAELLIPADHQPAVMIAAGYLGDPEALPAARRAQELEPRTRKPLSDFVYGATWGETAGFVVA